jgi:hypothetical protein
VRRLTVAILALAALAVASRGPDTLLDIRAGTLLLEAVHQGPGSNLKLELRIRGNPEAVGGG